MEWDGARECVEAEARWVSRAARAPTAEEFDRILSGAAEEESPDDFDWLFRGLNVGVAGLTLVLSAASYATCFSCRTHPVKVGDHMPQVLIAAEPQRVRVPAGYAARAGCGVVGVDDWGLVSVTLPPLISSMRWRSDARRKPSWRSFPSPRGVRGCWSTSPAKTLMSSTGLTTKPVSVAATR
jgi:hypothetical protein